MIVLFRVDDRLLHGQVARSWTKQYGIQKIIIINDETMNDEFSKMTLCLAKPQNVDLIFSDKQNAHKYLEELDGSDERVMCIVNCFEDAMFVLPNIPRVKKINVGGLRNKSSEPGLMINRSVILSSKDTIHVKQLLNEKYELEIRQIPSETPVYLEDFIE